VTNGTNLVQVRLVLSLLVIPVSTSLVKRKEHYQGEDSRHSRDGKDVRRKRALKSP